MYRLPNGKYHRLDGPAFYYKDMQKYYIGGKEYTPTQFWDKQKHTKYATKIMAHILGNRDKK